MDSLLPRAWILAIPRDHAWYNDHQRGRFLAAGEIFRKLDIGIKPDRMATVADLIERSRPAGWARDRASEDRGRAEWPTYCSTHTAADGRLFATLIGMQKDERLLCRGRGGSTRIWRLILQPWALAS
jgi:hypothetical protein